MIHKLIKGDKEYQIALNRLEDLFHAKKGSKLGDELDLLT
jgi:hypothetical protein